MLLIVGNWLTKRSADVRLRKLQAFKYWGNWCLHAFRSRRDATHIYMYILMFETPESLYILNVTSDSCGASLHLILVNMNSLRQFLKNPPKHCSLPQGWNDSVLKVQHFIHTGTDVYMGNWLWTWTNMHVNCYSSDLRRYKLQWGNSSSPFYSNKY